MADATTIALVTRANKGIGRAIGERDAGRGEEAIAALRSAGGDAHLIVVDVTDPASIQSAAADVGRRFGRLDVLVNNAGISGSLAGQTPGTLTSPRSGRFSRRTSSA